MSSPILSVVMSVYNAEEYLRLSLDSILEQSYVDFEFIIVNDGSTDSSLDILNSYEDPRIVLISQENRGLSAALNKGISVAKGKYIARMDADDIALPERFEKQLCFLETNSSYVAVGSNAIYIDKTGRELYTSQLPITNEEILDILPASPFFHSSTMYRKDVFLLCKGYNEKVKQFLEDRILWNKMRKYGMLGNVAEPLIKYRLVPGSISGGNFKDHRIWESLCNHIIESDDVSDEDVTLLLNFHKLQSKSVKLAIYHLRIGKIYLEHQFDRKKAIKNLFLSLRYNIKSRVAFFNLFLCCLPRFIIVRWKQSRGVFFNG